MTGKNCPNWGSSWTYGDCDLCPTVNECIEEEKQSSEVKSE